VDDDHLTQLSTTSLDTEKDLSNLTFTNLNENRKLVFDDKDSLAMQSLQQGQVDFYDDRVKIKAAAN